MSGEAASMRTPAKARPKRHPYHEWSPDARALDLVGDKWTLLIVRDLSSGPRRFVALQRVLPGISTEQLRSRLSRMVADGLLIRRPYREIPPRVDYELTNAGKELLPVLGAFARWGYDWAWGAPREAEAIDIGAILRLAPGLVEPPAAARGVAVLSVHGVAGEYESHYALTVEGGAVSIAERDDPDADARVWGSESAWIDALGPDARRAGLQVAGDAELAELLLDGICHTRDSGGDRTLAV
jgi:DNA-binding HxlR family transcriptional regulator